MFLLNSGRYQTSKLEHSYARRAQSTIKSLKWNQIAIIKTNCPSEAEKEAIAALKEWGQYAIDARWQIEGIGLNAGFLKEIVFAS